MSNKQGKDNSERYATLEYLVIFLH